MLTPVMLNWWMYNMWFYTKPWFVSLFFFGGGGTSLLDRSPLQSTAPSWKIEIPLQQSQTRGDLAVTPTFFNTLTSLLASFLIILITPLTSISMPLSFRGHLMSPLDAKAQLPAFKTSLGLWRTLLVMSLFDNQLNILLLFFLVRNIVTFFILII